MYGASNVAVEKSPVPVVSMAALQTKDNVGRDFHT